MCANRPAVAQPSPADEHWERTADNALYVEALGPGLLYSLNYEHAFGKFSTRAGVGWIPWPAYSGDGPGSASILSVPLTVSYLGIGSPTNIFEIGAGATIIDYACSSQYADHCNPGTFSQLGATAGAVAIIGYRFQPPNGGFLFRAGISPIIGPALAPIGTNWPVIPSPYLSLGGAF